MARYFGAIVGFHCSVGVVDHSMLMGVRGGSKFVRGVVGPSLYIYISLVI